ncbi:MAG: type IX secretion system membrane protein PorP/SprF [Bacteroidetes bacterium]|nr:type IX secretion system membrane protein PorP/SprF [Bacteroidota bacterium]
MKKYKLYILLLLIPFSGVAQQSAQYSQFMMNEYGLNPAVAGSGKGLYIMVGRRTQWRGFSLAPETNFASITKAWGKKGYKYYWHGVGAYVEQDKFGIFTNKAAYGSYAIHLKLSSKYYLSFGVAAGIKSVGLTNTVFNEFDPALSQNGPKVLLPDIIPGLYLYSKKVSIGISIRNLYKNTLRQGSKEIGTGSRLLPTAVFTASKKFKSAGYDFVFVPGINIQSNFIGIPSSQFNFMTYYRQRIGVGVTYRMHDAVSAMIQIRVLKNVVIGFAYDYTISQFRSANANSTEFMMGMTPVMSSEGYDKPNGAADCPKFDFDF